MPRPEAMPHINSASCTLFCAMRYSSARRPSRQGAGEARSVSLACNLAVRRWPEVEWVTQDGGDVNSDEGASYDTDYFDGSSAQQAQHPTAMRHGSRTTEDHRLVEQWSWALFLHERCAPISGDGERLERAGHTVPGVEF